VAADWINTTAPVYSDSITYLRKPVQALAATFLFLSAPHPTGVTINVNAASISLGTNSPAVQNSGAAMLWAVPPTYLQSEAPVRNNWIGRDWLLTQPTGSNINLPLPVAHINLSATVPIPYEATMWLNLPSDDGWWPDVGETFRLNPNFNFELLAAPTTPPPIHVNVGTDSIALNAISPDVQAGGHGVTISVGYDTISLTGYVPAISAGNPSFIIPVAQIVLSGIAPYVPNPLLVPQLGITLAAYAPLVENGGQYTVPNVLNSPLISAETAIIAAGYTVGTITTAYSIGFELGTVSAQSPSGGTNASFGSQVSLTESLGPAPGTMPLVLGQFYLKAIQTLAALGLNVQINEQPSKTVKPRFVIGQSVTGGSAISMGQLVILTVSQDPLLAVSTTQPYPLV
jgi:hypothetical protein